MHRYILFFQPLCEISDFFRNIMNTKIHQNIKTWNMYILSNLHAIAVVLLRWWCVRRVADEPQKVTAKDWSTRTAHFYYVQTQTKAVLMFEALLQVPYLYSLRSFYSHFPCHLYAIWHLGKLIPAKIFHSSLFIPINPIMSFPLIGKTSIETERELSVIVWIT